MIKKVEMFVFHCTACPDTQAPPQFGDWLPHGWEEETFEGKPVHYCPFHRYGLDMIERNRVMRRVRAETP